MNILLAEDSRSISNLIAGMISELGYKVRCVGDGAAAVDECRKAMPDLIITDIVMPILDGIQAIKEIRRLPSKRWVPIMVLTSQSEDSKLIEAMNAGADDYLVKPVNFEILKARLKSKQRVLEIQDSYVGVLDNVFEGILTITALGKIQTFNTAAERIFGYHRDEVVGNNVNMLMPDPYHSEHDKYIRTYLTTNNPKVIGIGRRVQGKRKNGELFPMHLAVTQIETAKGINFIGLVRDISEEVAAQKKIEYLALHDALTGLHNRASFTSYINGLGESATEFSILFIDIDGFKPINDTFGHDTGDEVLKRISETLLQCVPEDAFVARLGGDEFVLVLQDTREYPAPSYIGEKIIESLRPPLRCKGNQCQVGASIGIAWFPDSGKSVDAVLNAADEAMYKAKKSGKNRVVEAAKI